MNGYTKLVGVVLAEALHQAAQEFIADPTDLTEHRIGDCMVAIRYYNYDKAGSANMLANVPVSEWVAWLAPPTALPEPPMPKATPLEPIGGANLTRSTPSAPEPSIDVERERKQTKLAEAMNADRASKEPKQTWKA